MSPDVAAKPTTGVANHRRQDRTFRSLTQIAAVVVVLVMIGIAVFLITDALPALRRNTGGFLTTSDWDPDGTPPVFGIAALAFGSLVSSALAMVMAVPVAVGVSLFITQYAPRRLAVPLGYLVDLLAAVPSVVYGLWGLVFLVPALVPTGTFLNGTLGFIPIFSSNGAYGRSMFAAAVLLAIMVLPIVAAITREVFVQAPKEQIEGAYALGATKWEMIRYAILPHGRSGIASGAVLGFGRAIGETIAVALVLSANYSINWHILEPGGNTIAANIANRFGEAGATGRGALIASGLVLFVITVVVNYVARLIVTRTSVEARAKAGDRKRR